MSAFPQTMPGQQEICLIQILSLRRDRPYFTAALLLQAVGDTLSVRVAKHHVLATIQALQQGSEAAYRDNAMPVMP